MSPALSISTLVLALLQFLAPAFARVTGIGTPIAEIAARGGAIPPETPMGYAFSIWFLIFALALAYGARCATRAGKDDAGCAAIAPGTCGIFATSTLWMLYAQIAGDGWHLVTLIWLMWAFSVRGLLRALKLPDPTSFFSQVVLPMLGLYAGWLSVAVFLNTTSVIADTFGTFDLSPTAYALFTLFPATGLALYMIFKTRGHLWYTGAVLWALVAVIIGNLLRENADPAVALAATGLLCTALLGFFFARHPPYRAS